jgi:hypothetical protein
MTKIVKSQAQPQVILYGLSSIGKPMAGTFKGTDVAAARKAAGKLGLSVIDVSDDAGRTLAAKVPSGRIQGHGDGIVPFVAKDLYGEIKALVRTGASVASAQNPPSGKPAVATPRLPANWDDIKVGDLVLAQDTDPADGWWQAIVLEAAGDLFKMRWPRSERGRPFQKHRLTLGLICPGANGQTISSDSKKASTDAEPRFPKDWGAIGLEQIVLAKEDGPAEQWWDAETIKVDKDVFTLQWRGYTNLPVIVRPRLALGLVHPAPKAR